jgi:hypothetical protein
VGGEELQELPFAHSVLDGTWLPQPKRRAAARGLLHAVVKLTRDFRFLRALSDLAGGFHSLNFRYDPGFPALFNFELVDRVRKATALADRCAAPESHRQTSRFRIPSFHPNRLRQSQNGGPRTLDHHFVDHHHFVNQMTTPAGASPEATNSATGVGRPPIVLAATV